MRKLLDHPMFVAFCCFVAVIAIFIPFIAFPEVIVGRGLSYLVEINIYSTNATALLLLLLPLFYYCNDDQIQCLKMLFKPQTILRFVTNGLETFLSLSPFFYNSDTKYNTVL